jgi:hypothetical protein
VKRKPRSRRRPSLRTDVEADQLYVDAGGGQRQTYTEDCPVCCRPRVVHVEPGDEPGEVRVWLERGE